MSSELLPDKVQIRQLLGSNPKEQTETATDIENDCIYKKWKYKIKKYSRECDLQSIIHISSGCMFNT